MGLDMYLYAEKSEFKSEHFCYPRNTKLSIDYPDELKQFIRGEYFGPTVEQRVEYKIGYWRKANQIHKFFVDLVDGDDDGRPIYVNINILEELLDRCHKVLEDHTLAETLLPTQSGFFFGSTEYDEDYFDDLQDTIDQVEPIVKFLKDQDEAYHKLRDDTSILEEDKVYPVLYCIKYQASW